jgi:hypothetical protein
MGIAERVAARAQGLPVPPRGRDKTAAFPPQEEAGPAKRNIPKGHEFNKKALKPLSKTLWASSVALGHALTAYRHLSRLKSTTVSPDGLLGGRGYTMGLQDMRKKLHDAAEILSAISDTVYDEITAPHWQPQLAQLDEGDAGDVTRFIEEAEEVLEDPEADSTEKIEEIEKEDNSDKAPKEEAKGEDPEAEEDSSSLPNSGDADSDRNTTKVASALWSQKNLDLTASSIYVANSSLPVGQIPGGPRVDHIGPGEGKGVYDEYNQDTGVSDDWSADGGGPGRRDPTGEDYDYTSPWENTASASIPDSSTDSTPTEGRDFGLGFGARGQGTQHANPSGEGGGYRGVHGPQSALPGTPSSSSGDSTRDVIDDKLNERQAFEALYGTGALPQDVAGPVSRSDYFDGAKDNMVSVGTSEMPGSDQANGTAGQPLVDTHYTQEDTNTEYVRWDNSTKTLRDPEGDHPGQDHQEPWAPDGEATR